MLYLHRQSVSLLLSAMAIAHCAAPLAVPAACAAPLLAAQEHAQWRESTITIRGREYRVRLMLNYGLAEQPLCAKQ